MEEIRSDQGARGNEAEMGGGSQQIEAERLKDNPR
jgi:hypothetical protein